MSQASPQRIITISIIGTTERADVYYSYVSPLTGLSYTYAPVCDIVADQPINSLYLLDYFSAQNGWTITGISPREGSPQLETAPGALKLSIMTINPYTNMDTYKFFIHYQNIVNGNEMERDPQVTNVPRPPS